MASYITNASSATSLLFILSAQAFYLGFEVAIGIIQAYIFCLLLSLYTNEHPTIQSEPNH